MKKIVKKIYFKIGFLLGFFEEKTNNKTLYKIGNVKIHNSEIDSLIPQAVTIGDNFISAPNSIVLAHDASTFNHTKKHRVEETVIGDNVFLGAGSIILPGVKINDGAIIGAGAVVTKDVAAFTIVAGNPAKFMCNVNDYIEKCEKRNVLFDTPASFENFYSNKLEKKHLKEFQNKYLTKKKNVKN
tara:strand:+ start:2297 stop:2851 length:555 start_codon:yes stop_codon:yes gene_type:complete